MCGICGYFYLDGSRPASKAVVAAMAASLSHRGPDADGLFVKGPVALGHRRLSIIDLETGDQPMFNEAGSVAVVQNGEIYNFQDLRHDLERKGHTFSTRSDTEVILHAYEEYGESCVEKLDGMFGFVLWDMTARKLFLARDRYGKKPLYYSAVDGQFIFGSEPKALFRHPAVRRTIDKSALSEYLAYDYVPSPGTIFKDIYRLEAGTALSVSRSGIRKRKYWDPSFDIQSGWSRDLTGCAERLTRLFREATRKRLISDVPLGVFLSGGIDSSAVVASMAALRPSREIKTFSIGFDESSYDESSSARAVADHFATEHHQKTLHPKLMLEVLPEIVDILDEPFADSSIIPTYLVSRYTRDFVKVALGGDGGDELFMGYPSFVAHTLAVYIDRFPSSAKKLLMYIAPLLNGSSDQLSVRFRLQRFLKGLPFDGALRHQAWIGTFAPAQQEALLSPIKRSISLDPADVYSSSVKHIERVRHLNVFDQIIYLYMKTYMTDDILAKVDRASMASGLEVRAPFLDTEFSSFANTIPHTLKLKGLSGKFILKQALRGTVPDGVLKKKKHGFAVPVSRWFRNELKDSLIRTLDKRKIEREGLFNADFIDLIVKEHISGRKDHGREIWSLFIFELWYNKWVLCRESL